MSKFRKLGKLLLCFAGETCYKCCAESNSGDFFTQFLYKGSKLFSVAAAVHVLKYLGVAVLNR